MSLETSASENGEKYVNEFMFAGKMCLTDCVVENCPVRFVILLMKNVPKSSAVRVDEGGRGGGQRREENVLKSMRELGELLIYGAFPLHGTARYGSLLGGFPLGTVPGTWYFFSTTSAEVPSDPYRYQNVTCKLC